MRLIIDKREHSLFDKCKTIIENDRGYVTIESQVLHLGDILMKTDEGKDVMIIERKSLSDLLSSIKDGRYEEQSHRLKNASGFPGHNVVYIIEGMFSTLRTFMEKKLVISAMASLNYFKGFSVMRTSNINETAELLIYMADKIDRNFMKGILPSYMLTPNIESIVAPHSITSVANIMRETEPTGESLIDASTSTSTATSTSIEGSAKPASYSEFVKCIKKENITQENIGEIMLCQIPGISTTYAAAILKTFNGFSNMMIQIKNGSAKFDSITYESKGKPRKIPKTCGQIITQFLQNI